MKKYLEAGKIVGTHGIRGEVRVDPWCDSPAFLAQFKTLYLKGIKEEHQPYKAIGCRQLIDYFKGLCTLNEAVEKIKQESRRYAKRQLTWMKSEDAIWLNGTQEENINTIIDNL